MFAMALMNTLAYERVPAPLPPLPDVGYDLVSA